MLDIINLKECQIGYYDTQLSSLTASRTTFKVHRPPVLLIAGVFIKHTPGPPVAPLPAPPPVLSVPLDPWPPPPPGPPEAPLPAPPPAYVDPVGP